MAEGIKTQPKRPAGPELWELRKEEILTNAAHLFATHGYSDTDTQLLAETIGVGKGTVYRYFRSKRELFLAAVDRVMRMLFEQVDTTTVGITDPLVRIRTGTRAFFEFFAENPEFVELLIQERALFKDRTKPTFIEHRLANIDRWVSIYRGLIADGRVREIAPETITDTVGNLLYGTIFMNYFSGRSVSGDVQAKEMLDILFLGILSEPERARHAQTNPPNGEES